MNQQAGKAGEFKLELAWNSKAQNIVRVDYGVREFELELARDSRTKQVARDG